MKYSLLITFCFWAHFSFGQVTSSMPPEASIFYNKAIDIISPEINNLVLSYSLKIKVKRIEPEQLLNELSKERRLRKLNKADLDWIAILIMVQANKNTDDELKKKVVEFRKNPRQEGMDEIKFLSEFKRFLASNTTQFLDSTTISQKSVLNNLKR